MLRKIWQKHFAGKSLYWWGLARDFVIIATLYLAFHGILSLANKTNEEEPEPRLSYFSILTENYTLIEYNHEGDWWVLCLPDNVFMEPYIIQHHVNNQDPTIVKLER